MKRNADPEYPLQFGVLEIRSFASGELILAELSRIGDQSLEAIRVFSCDQVRWTAPRCLLTNPLALS
jgi:hypothetical protein